MWPATWGVVVGTIVTVGVLVFWVCCIARGFAAGKWMDASLVTVVVGELAYLEWGKRS